MKVPTSLSLAFGSDFEKQIAGFATREGLMPSAEEIRSKRFLSRSIVPHVQKLSEMFNRLSEAEPPSAQATKKALQAELEKRHRQGLDPYWKESSNPAHLRLAYFLYFMPSNLYRVASIWSELARLGFRWDAGPLRGLELGAGPATGACGIAAGERATPVGIPMGEKSNWALIERDRSMLELGARWAQDYFGELAWGVRTFHRTLDLAQPLLPPSAPRFNLWLMSYFINESPLSAPELAKNLIRSWERHLEQEGLVIIVEPALRFQSRRLLELRQALLAQKPEWLQVLLPCLGHQACGALATEGDWCHEEVSWWRPPYFKIIDELAGLDRKTLPFSYLVLARSKKTREELLPALAGSTPEQRHRLVSPSHAEGKELEFFVCGQDGKRRARYRPETPELKKSFGRGDILLGSDIRGDKNASRVEGFREKT